MEYIRTAIPEVVLIKPKVHGDQRGFFMETFRQSEFEEYCGSAQFVQDNHSGSGQGILRGLHYQLKNNGTRQLHSQQRRCLRPGLLLPDPPGTKTSKRAIWRRA